MMRDPDFGVVRLRAFGTYDFRIVDAPLFLKEVAGTDQHFRLDEFQDTMRSRIVSVFTDALARAHVPVLDVAGRYAEMGEALLPIINPSVREKYGLEISSFILENVSVPAEVEQAIDKQSSMRAIGNLNDYVKYQMGLSMGQGGEGGSAAAMPAQMAMGFAMAQDMMRGMGTGASASGASASGAPGAASGTASVTGAVSGQGMATVQGASGGFSGAAGHPASVAALEVLTPEQAAQLLSVSVEDVLASIQSGELKARRIGTAYRIARSALDEFLRG